jgi:hypothetical protein
MNKYLMMTAAALLGSAAPALAAADQYKTHTVHFFTASGVNSYCDGASFQKPRGPTASAIAMGLHLNEDCAGKNGQIVGGVNKTVYSFFEIDSLVTSESFVFNIYKPIKSGGAWDLWVCLNATSCFEGTAGVYKLGFPAGRGSRASTVSRVAEMIAERKAARTRQVP